MYLAASLVSHILFPAFRRLRGKNCPTFEADLGIQYIEFQHSLNRLRFCLKNPKRCISSYNRNVCIY